MPRPALVILVTLLGCRDRQVSENARPSPIETAIARDLTARFGTPATVACALAANNVPVRCDAKLADGTVLPIAIENASKDEWGWRVDGHVIEARTIIEHVQGELATLKLEQTATCGAPIQVVKAGERIACTLSGGGAAFVHVGSGGETTLELALDAASAAARTELVTPERDRQLHDQSKALELLEGESDGEEEVRADAGIDGGIQ